MMESVIALPAEIYQADRGFIWGLCYRMTGNAADADDLVQETFLKALESPPRDTALPLRPWLARVAINLSRDLLRRRRRRGYTGQWLPSPIPTEEGESLPSFEPMAAPEDSPMARYDMLESVSFAFLLAVEALTPSQRAVLLLRDVFDYSTREAADALGIKESSAKVILHRARRRMREYEKNRALSSTGRREAASRALEQFLLYLGDRDIDALERLLTEDVIDISDGGGEVFAALRPICGRDKVLRYILGLAEKFNTLPPFSLRLLNGQPALLFEMTETKQGFARRFTIQIEVEASGRIRRIYSVLAPKKLSALA